MRGISAGRIGVLMVMGALVPVTRAALAQAPAPERQPAPTQEIAATDEYEAKAFLEVARGRAMDIGSREFDRVKRESFGDQPAGGDVTWLRFGWGIEDTPAYFQAGVMRTTTSLSDDYGTGTLKVTMAATAIDLGFGAFHTPARVPWLTLLADLAVMTSSAELSLAGGGGRQTTEDAATGVIVHAGARARVYGPLGASLSLQYGALVGRAALAGLVYVF